MVPTSCGEGTGAGSTGVDVAGRSEGLSIATGAKAPPVQVITEADAGTVIETDTYNWDIGLRDKP